MPAPALLAGGLGPAGAAAAYRAAAGEAPAPDGVAFGASPDGPSFGAALQRAVEQGIELGRTADAAATRAMLGQGGVTEAVLAVSRAEVALQAAVAVRDRVVSAYQEVMRMPV
jgi:flagellar hook-basal body complex protein FliE